MPPLPFLSLDRLDSAAGCIQHLLISECLGPEGLGYDFQKMQIVTAAMKCVLFNRQALNQNYRFCSVEAQNIIDYICAPVSNSGCQSKQFNGFDIDGAGNTAVVSAAILARIGQSVSTANNPAHPKQLKYHSHIAHIIAISKAANTIDPYGSIDSTINGIDVYPGVYGWRTANTADPGGDYVRIPAISLGQYPDGTLQNIKFYTIADTTFALKTEQNT